MAKRPSQQDLWMACGADLDGHAASIDRNLRRYPAEPDADFRDRVLVAAQGGVGGYLGLINVGLLEKAKDPACVVYGNPTGTNNPFERIPYTLRDHEAATWRNRPDADETLYDAPDVAASERWAPLERMAFVVGVTVLAWLLVVGVFALLANLLRWALGLEPSVAIGVTVGLFGVFPILVFWVRR